MTREQLCEQVEVHDTLNKKIWGEDNKLLPEVRERLEKVIELFKESIDFPLDIVDVHIVGSNASYNYTDKSDLDVHLVANFETSSSSQELLQQLCNQKKQQFNSKYDIKIRGLEIEMYIEDINQGTMSNGIYSMYEDDWVKFPKPIETAVSYDVSKEVQHYRQLIADAIQNGNSDELQRLLNQVYLMRKNSLAVDGEYARGNQIFKQLRDEGMLDLIRDNIATLLSKSLSLESLS